MNIQLGNLRAALLQAADACNDPVAIVEFSVENGAGITQPHKTTIRVEFWTPQGVDYDKN